MKKYSKAIAGFIVPFGTQLLAQFGFSTDLTLGEFLGALATSLAGGAVVYQVRNTPKTPY